MGWNLSPFCTLNKHSQSRLQSPEHCEFICSRTAASFLGVSFMDSIEERPPLAKFARQQFLVIRKHKPQTPTKNTAVLGSCYSRETLVDFNWLIRLLLTILNVFENMRRDCSLFFFSRVPRPCLVPFPFTKNVSPHNPHWLFREKNRLPAVYKNKQTNKQSAVRATTAQLYQMYLVSRWCWSNVRASLQAFKTYWYNAHDFLRTCY